MNYDVEREYGQWHIRDEGQTTRGTTVTDSWLKQMKFGPLTRINIDDVLNAIHASAGGVTLDESAFRQIRSVA